MPFQIWLQANVIEFIHHGYADADDDDDDDERPVSLSSVSGITGTPVPLLNAS